MEGRKVKKRKEGKNEGSEGVRNDQEQHGAFLLTFLKSKNSKAAIRM